MLHDLLGMNSSIYRTTAILSQVHTAFFNYHYFSKMTNMPDEIILARIMTALDLEFERTEHYTTMMMVMTVIMTMT